MSFKKFKTWRCGLCQEPVIEGQRMVALRKYGYVHVECFYELLKKKYPNGIPRDILALSDANEALAYAIVRLKQAQRISDEESEFLVSVRNKIEDITGEVDDRLSDKLGL